VTSIEDPGAFECDTAVTPLPLRLGEYVADSDCASISSAMYETRFEAALLIVAGAWLGRALLDTMSMRLVDGGDIGARRDMTTCSARGR